MLIKKFIEHLEEGHFLWSGHFKLYDTAPYCIFEGYVSVSYFVGGKEIKKPHQSKMMKLRMTGFEC